MLENNIENQLQALKEIIECKDKKLQYTNTLLISLMLDVKKWIVVLEEATGEELFLNNTAKFIKKSDSEFANKLYDSLIKCRCKNDNTPVLWEYTYEDEFMENTPNKMYYTIASYYVPWGESYAIAHVIDDTTAAKRAELEMHNMAFKDSLTDLFNRRYAMQLLDNWINEKLDFCVAFIDIDYLKYCNDVYGHHEGDKYIMLIIEYLNEIPDDKILCRIGGDEFMVIKRDTTADEMDRILDNIRKRLLAYDNANEVKYRRSYSFGTCTTNYSINLPLERILRIADQKMYQFKYANKLK